MKTLLGSPVEKHQVGDFTLLDIVGVSSFTVIGYASVLAQQPETLSAQCANSIMQFIARHAALVVKSLNVSLLDVGQFVCHDVLLLCWGAPVGHFCFLGQPTCLMSKLSINSVRCKNYSKCKTKMQLVFSISV